jgi:hypothetical protein
LDAPLTNPSPTQRRQYQLWKISGALGGLAPKPTSRADYDTSSGLLARSRSLHDLNEVVVARHRAGYVRRERLAEFVVLGRFWLDSCGNLMHINHTLEFAPRVIDIDGLRAIYESRGLPMSFNASLGGPTALAHDDIPCSVCGQKWTIDDCWNCDTNEVVSPRDFVGKTLGAFRRSLRLKWDAHYAVQPDAQIRNDRYIDLTVDPKYPSHKRNERGWCRERLPASYVIQPGDEILVNRFRFDHPGCHAEWLARRVEGDFREMFAAAGFPADQPAFKQTESYYGVGQENWTGPSFQVSTPLGPIGIGWRKRVIEIRWPTFTEDFKLLFADQEVTKGPGVIHAWGRDAAVDYLGRLRTALPAHAA